MYKIFLENNKGVENNINIDITGSKNSSLPIICALPLTKAIFEISNVDDYDDILSTLDILSQLGVKYSIDSNKKYIFDTRNILLLKSIEGCQKLRASYYFIGSLLHYQKELIYGYPGGCSIGDRKIDEHIRFFEKIGCSVKFNNLNIIIDSEHFLYDGSFDFTFKMKSIGATMNALLGGVIGKGTIILKNIEIDPIVLDLINFLNMMGAKIIIDKEILEIQINRVSSLHGTNYNIMPDPIVTGSYLSFFSILKLNKIIQNVVIGPIYKENLGEFFTVIQKLGIKLVDTKQQHYYSINIQKKMIDYVELETESFPGLYTDLQPFVYLLLFHFGISGSINEMIMNNRFNYIYELEKIGYSFEKIDNTIKLNYFELNDINKKEIRLKSTDIRGGMCVLFSIIIALLENRVNIGYLEGINFIKRGYYNYIDNFNKLGIMFEKVTDLSNLSYFNIGGYVKYYKEVTEYSDLVDEIKKCHKAGDAYYIIGDGSNIYFDDGFYDGKIIKNSVKYINQLKFFDQGIKSDEKYDYFSVSSGYSLNDMVIYLANHNCDMNELSDIPGTLGGAVFGNAGAYGKEIKDYICYGTLIDTDGNLVNYKNEDFKFSYRKSILSDNRYILLSLIIKAPVGDKVVIEENIKKISTIRRNKLPYDKKTCGSYFKNINFDSIKIPTGWLIQTLNLSDAEKKVGQIEIYEKHYNIFINSHTNQNSCSNLRKLIKNIKDKIFNKYGIILEEEVKFVTFDKFIKKID